MHSFFWPVTDMICGVQMLVGYFVGAMMAINGTITVGTFLAYMGLIVWIIFPMRNLGRLIVQISTGMVSYNRVMEIIREEREPLDERRRPTREGEPRGELIFDNVGFEYEPGKPVLEDISFHVQAGQVVALLGSTGSGKTSLVNLLPRFYDYTSGEHHCSTASNSTATRAAICASRSASSSRSRSCSRARSAKTSPTALAAR